MEPHIKYFICEVCGDSAANFKTVGVESDRDMMWPVRLCQRCGPIDLELMQLCREITIGHGGLWGSGT